MTDSSDLYEPLDTDAPYALEEVCEVFVVEKRLVLEMVEFGILTPEGEDVSTWRFGAAAILRLQRARRLRRDLEINLAGIAVALDLLDELDRTRQRVKTLETHLAQLIDND
jgi:chaperone modulatory protein CbpM